MILEVSNIVVLVYTLKHAIILAIVSPDATGERASMTIGTEKPMDICLLTRLAFVESAMVRDKMVVTKTREQGFRGNSPVVVSDLRRNPQTLPIWNPTQEQT